MARPSSPRTTHPLCIALVALAPRESSSGRRPDLADTPFAPPYASPRPFPAMAEASMDALP